MKLDVYALKQSAQDIYFISLRCKQGRKYDALNSSPLLTCQIQVSAGSDRLVSLHAVINHFYWDLEVEENILVWTSSKKTESRNLGKLGSCSDYSLT